MSNSYHQGRYPENSTQGMRMQRRVLLIDSHQKQKHFDGINRNDRKRKKTEPQRTQRKAKPFFTAETQRAQRKP